MKVTAEQKYMLLQFIEGNENIAKNNLSNNFTAKDAMKLWQEITNKLNACLGPVKTWKAWRKCWQDMKSITKAKAAAYNREGTQTGGGAPEFSEPNDFQKRVIALIGKNATHGHEDVQESPIIFDIENPSETHANEEKNSNSVDSSDLSSFDQTPSTSKSPSTSTKFVSTLLPTSNPPSTFIQTLSTSHPPTFSSPSSKTTTLGTKGSIRKTRQTTLKRSKLMLEDRSNERDAHFFEVQDKMLELKEEEMALLKRKLQDENEWREKVLDVKKTKVEELKKIGMYLEKIIKK